MTVRTVTAVARKLEVDLAQPPRAVGAALTMGGEAAGQRGGGALWDPLSTSIPAV